MFFFSDQLFHQPHTHSLYTSSEHSLLQRLQISIERSADEPRYNRVDRDWQLSAGERSLMPTSNISHVASSLGPQRRRQDNSSSDNTAHQEPWLKDRTEYNRQHCKILTFI